MPARSCLLFWSKTTAIPAESQNFLTPMADRFAQHMRGQLKRLDDDHYADAIKASKAIGLITGACWHQNILADHGALSTGIANLLVDLETHIALKNGVLFHRLEQV